jgi:enediyne biosynthesis protein E4
LLFHNNGNGFDNVYAAVVQPSKSRIPPGDLPLVISIMTVVWMWLSASVARLLILHNIVRNASHWIGLNLVGRAVGAKITWSVNGVEHGIFKRGGGSYLYSCDPRDVLGLGPAEYADWIQVQWPTAIRRTDRFEHMRAGKYYSLVPGGKLL